MDKTKINLARLRAYDENPWEENKHPRANNGQFTSGSGSAAGGSKPASESPLRKAAKTIQGKGELKGYKGLSFTQETSEADSGTPEGEVHNFIVGNLKNKKPTKENITAACKQITNMLHDDIKYLRDRANAAKEYGNEQAANKWESQIGMLDQKIRFAYKIIKDLNK